MASPSQTHGTWDSFFIAVGEGLREFADKHWPLEADGSGPSRHLSLHRLFESFPVPVDVILLDVSGIDSFGTEHYSTALRFDFSRPKTCDVRLHGAVPVNDLGSYPELIEGILGFEPDVQEALKRPGTTFGWEFPHSVHVVPYDPRNRPLEYVVDLAGWLSAPWELAEEAFPAKVDFNAKYGLTPDPLLTDEQLLQSDEITRCFVKLSDGKPLAISERHSSIAHIQLIPQVPDSVRRVFRQAKRLYVCSYLEYAFFTVSLHYAHLALDAALHARWSALLPSSVTISYLEKKTGKKHQQIMPNPSHVAIRNFAQRAGWPVPRIQVDGKPFPYQVKMVVGELADRALLTMWQRKIIEEFDIKIRNRLTHLESAPVYGPSGYQLEIVAETINRLFDSLPHPPKAVVP